MDVEVIRAACQAACPDVEITLDVNAPWTVREALDMTEKLRPLNLRWIEEPVWPPENYSGLATVRKQGGIPVAAGENASKLMDVQHLLEAGALDFVQPSPAKMGGITELQKVYALANAHGVTVMDHAFYDSPGLLAAVHGSAALGGAKSLVEWRYFDLEAQLYAMPSAAIPAMFANQTGAYQSEAATSILVITVLSIMTFSAAIYLIDGGLAAA